MDNDLECLVRHLRDDDDDDNDTLTKMSKLREFFEKHQTSRDFSAVSATLARHSIEALHETLCQLSTQVSQSSTTVCSSEPEMVTPVLNVLLVLTRNTQCQTELLQTFLPTLLTHASIVHRQTKTTTTEGESSEEETFDCNSISSRLAAVKCLCNIVFQSQHASGGMQALRDVHLEQLLAQHLVSSVLTPRHLPQYPLELLSFEITLLFLYTAIAVDCRAHFIHFPGMKSALLTAIDFLLLHLRRGAAEQQSTQTTDETSTSTTTTTSHASVLANLLKTLYTLLAGLERQQRDEEKQEQEQEENGGAKGDRLHEEDSDSERDTLFLERVTVACRDILLLTDVSTPHCFSGVGGDLLCHTYSVLGVIASPVLKTTFLQPSEGNEEDTPTLEKDEDEAVLAVNRRLLAQLLGAIGTVAAGGMQESCSSSCTVKMTLFLALCNLCRSCRLVRRHLRLHILPPRKDVHVMPQEGHQLKNHLVRMMTGVNREVGELVSEFVFVLCKENVDRLLKYTGYGNAAGMMFTRGLGLRSPPPPPSDATDYSEDEDTDTEEFKGHQHGFNYVTGRYEPPRAAGADPLEGMSEERKVVETEKLLNTLSRMHCQPMTLGEHGQPVPLFDHIAHRAATTSRDTDSPSSSAANSSDDDEH